MCNNTKDILNWDEFLKNKIPVLVQLHPDRYAPAKWEQFSEADDWSFVDTIEFKIPIKNKPNKELIERITGTLDVEGGEFTELEDRGGELVFHIWREDKLTMNQLVDFHWLSEKYTDRLEPLLKEYGIKGCSLVMKILSLNYWEY